MAFQLEGKEMCCERYIPSLFSQKCCWSFHPKLVRIGKHAHSQQKKVTLTQTLRFHVKFMCMRC